MVKRLTINSVVSFFLLIVFMGVFIYTYYERLRPVELLIPRISIGLLMVGALLVIIGDYRKQGEAKELKRDLSVLPVVAGVSFIMWLYGVAFIRFGLASTTFVFLVGWWLYVAIRDSKKDPPLWPRIAKYALLAALLSGIIYVFFIMLLRIYLPRTLLF